MTFERIPSPSHPLYADAMALYGISFPAHEQRETPSQTAILTHPDYHFTAILDGSTFVGDMLYWETPDFRYIEHFCILPALRGQRYGSRALSMLPNDPLSISDSNTQTKLPSYHPVHLQRVPDMSHYRSRFLLHSLFSSSCVFHYLHFLLIRFSKL